ncbi:RecA-family ATPase [Paraburkholderia bannensis]|uniref:RecA-family ATPase n=1 Tax=Paraburkholderia bannensis TaxID=765414 RepID=A0A7W9WW84_9BURK|nr:MULTISPECIES: AAA family ATPase [Paraburkholderia]MBB3261189.1 RecA-family ATPase [Paraburkholderia sp. WP4_3_2]MBB6106226.1 RecA-family ATPase [Paraburkholderia bannensis]
MINETEIMRAVVANAERIVKTAPAQNGVVLVNAAELVPQPVEWLWNGWLARGKMHLLAGAPGQGKTTITVDFAATVTRGGQWPDGTPCEPGNVLIWSGEDDAADTLVPRLMAAGADLKRVDFISGVNINGELRPFDPARDMFSLREQTLRQGNIRLIIVDPIVSAVTGDSHKNTETRRALQPLVDLAHETGACLIGITHFSKGGQGADPTQRVIGSIAFAAVARVVMVAAKVRSDDGEDRRVLARSKSNIGPDNGGFEYHLEQCEPQKGIPASRIAWGAMLPGSAQELLTDPNEQCDESSSALDSATEFLREVLGTDVVPTKEVEREARQAGVALRTLRRAAQLLNVRKQRGAENKWYWSLPK